MDIPLVAGTPGDADPGALEAPVVTAAVHGDRAAVDRVVRAVHPLVLAYCRTRLRHTAVDGRTAEDLAQEVCLRVLTSLGTFRPNGRPFAAWVHTIAANALLDAHRAQRRRPTGPLSVDHEVTERAPGPEQRAVDTEQRARLRVVLGRLTERQRAVLVLRFVLGLDVDRTAEELGIARGAVRVTQHRALLRLREGLGDRYVLGAAG